MFCSETADSKLKNEQSTTSSLINQEYELVETKI